jgi:hypothetical protein
MHVLRPHIDSQANEVPRRGEVDLTSIVAVHRVPPVPAPFHRLAVGSGLGCRAGHYPQRALNPRTRMGTSVRLFMGTSVRLFLAPVGTLSQGHVREGCTPVGRGAGGR